MGHITHNAIVVTSWDAQGITAARDEAVRIGLQCTPIVDSSVNSFQTFCVVPDGSKSGWDDDEAGDTTRTLFKQWLVAQRYGDGSNSLEWVEVEYGNDDSSAKVVAHEWKRIARQQGGGK